MICPGGCSVTTWKECVLCVLLGLISVFCIACLFIVLVKFGFPMDLEYHVLWCLLHLLVPLFWGYSYVWRYYDKIVVSWWIVTSIIIYWSFWLPFDVNSTLHVNKFIIEIYCFQVFSIFKLLCIFVRVRLNVAYIGHHFSNPFCQSLPFNWTV
jgi:hypothetical protein